MMVLMISGDDQPLMLGEMCIGLAQNLVRATSPTLKLN